MKKSKYIILMVIVLCILLTTVSLANNMDGQRISPRDMAEFVDQTGTEGISVTPIGFQMLGIVRVIGMFFMLFMLLF